MRKELIYFYSLVIAHGEVGGHVYQAVPEYGHQMVCMAFGTTSWWLMLSCDAWARSGVVDG